jgi:hypothetical protein
VRKQETGRSSRIADPEADDVGMWCSTDPRRATQVLAAPPACTHTPHGSSAPINVSGDSTATTQARPRIPMSAHHTASTTSSQLCFRLVCLTGILRRQGRPSRSKPARPRAPCSNHNRRTHAHGGTRMGVSERRRQHHPAAAQLEGACGATRSERAVFACRQSDSNTTNDCR